MNLSREDKFPAKLSLTPEVSGHTLTTAMTKRQEIQEIQKVVEENYRGETRWSKKAQSCRLEVSGEIQEAPWTGGRSSQSPVRGLKDLAM